jgi:hypothetical protein
MSSDTRGYAYGHGGPASTSPSFITQEIDGFIFASETAINPAAVVTTLRRSLTTCNSTTRGYGHGGTRPPPGVSSSSEIDGLIFATETAINPAATAIQGRGEHQGIQSTTTGYFAGGDSAPLNRTEIDGLTFATETTTNPAAALTIAGEVEVGGNQPDTRGYWFRTGITWQFTFSTESLTTVTAAMPPTQYRFRTGQTQSRKDIFIPEYNNNSAVNVYNGMGSYDMNTQTHTYLGAVRATGASGQNMMAGMQDLAGL